MRRKITALVDEANLKALLWNWPKRSKCDVDFLSSYNADPNTKKHDMDI